MEAGVKESDVTEQQSSFGIKKIVDCKIAEGGRQMYKVKWESTWEPAETLASCQHLIDKFWSHVNKAKRNEEVAQQHRKRMRLEQGMNNIMNIGQNFDRISDENKEEVQRLIARTNATSVGSQILKSPSNMLMSSLQHMQENNVMGMAGIPMNANNQDSSHGPKSINFSSSQQKDNFKTSGDAQQNSPTQKGKFSVPGNKRNALHAKVEADDSKILMNDSKPGDSLKAVNNTGLKYLENFENPYVKIVLVCKICSKEQSLKRHDTWKRHFLTHAAKEDLPHKCTFCDKRFVTSGNLKTHMKTHLKGMPNDIVKKEESWLPNTMQQS